MRIVPVLALVLVVQLSAQPISPQRSQRQGIALLIGNINYPKEPLESVREDLRRVQPALEELGFETEVANDLDRPEEFRAAVSQFLQRKKADANDIVLVLYSGHGLQLEGSTYLLGKNYRTVTEPQAAAFGHAFSADELVRQLEQSPPYARIIIIDACRINAFTSQGQRGGIALRQNYDNTIVLFSNEPGKTVPARAATSLGSPFIEALIYALKTTNHGIKEIFETVRSRTAELSPGQVPQMTTSLNYSSKLLSVAAVRTPYNRAPELVDQAKRLYLDRSWEQFLETMRTARAVSSDSLLSARIDKEIAWTNEVRAAEAAAEKNDYKGEVAHWDHASSIFPARVWTMEKAALARLKNDDEEGAIPLLAVLSLVSDEPIASKARVLLSSLVKSDAGLGDLVEKSRSAANVPRGPEFELVEVKQ